MASLLAAFSDSGLAAQAGAALIALEPAGGGQTWRDDHDTVRLGGFGCEPASVRAGVGVAVGLGHVAGGGRTAEAVVDAYCRAGVVGLAALQGDYAFALWDPREHALLVGCDALGLQAPAYTWNDRVFLLSSRALELLPRDRRDSIWNDVFIAHALSGLWAPTGGETAFRGVTRMMGGEILRISANGIDRLRGDRLTFDGPRSVDEAVRAIEDGLDRVVTARAKAGPTCVELSGGLDSCVVAAALERTKPDLDAFSLVAPGDPGVANLDIEPLRSAFPRMRSHRIVVTPDLVPPNSLPIADDPICAGAGVWAGRVALAQAAQSGGFRYVLDGEGGDEMFDLVWWPGDFLTEMAVGPIVSAIFSRVAGRRMVRDFIVGAGGPLAKGLVQRARTRMRMGRPWLRPEFWESASLKAAHDQALMFSRLRSARERIPEVLAAQGRSKRAQRAARQWIGIEGVSPLLDRNLVEIIGSLQARVAMDLHHSKSLLRRVAERRVPPSVAWRAKSEPLHEWLVQGLIADDSRLARTVAFLRQSDIFSETIDPAALVATILGVRSSPVRLPVTSALAELFALVDWMAAVSACLGTASQPPQ